jgi:DNA replication and repair protein RecF
MSADPRDMSGEGATGVGDNAVAVLRALTVRDFRNLAFVELEASPAGFALVGDNGQGKTNLLEAIYYCHLLRAMRGARDSDLVRFGARGFHIHARATGAPYDEIRVGFERASKRKKIVLDGLECSRLSDALGALPAVVFSPADVAIVSGAPSLRRRFLDVALASTSRRYLAALQHYRAALARRNAALRASVRAADAAARVAVWEVPLARHGAILWRERAAWVDWAREPFAALCMAIGERGRSDVRYRSSIDVGDAIDDDGVRDALAAALAQHRERDLQRGLTGVGPHRDDLELRLGVHALRTFGSAGQQRTAALALRLLERRTYQERTGREPLVLLDDPFAELDPRRARCVLALLTDRREGQSVFAVPRPDDIPDALTGLQRFRIHEGAISEWRP